jgi:hypothetical protein
VTPTGEDAPVGAESDRSQSTIAGRAQPGEIAEDAPSFDDEGAAPAAGANPRSSASSAASAAGRPAAPAAAAQSSAAPASGSAARSSAAQDPDDSDAAAARTALPATASFIPAIWSGGIVALIAAFGMRFWRRSRGPVHPRA